MGCAGNRLSQGKIPAYSSEEESRCALGLNNSCQWKGICGMKQYIVDAFTNKPFQGNPAAVCVMETWPSEEFMMKLAMENNLSETAFVVKEE